jgi:hypothetical protein
MVVMEERVELERKVVKEEKVSMHHAILMVKMEGEVVKVVMVEMVLLVPVEAMEDKWCLNLTYLIWTYCILFISKLKVEQEAIVAKTVKEVLVVLVVQEELLMNTMKMFLFLNTIPN